MEIDRRRQKRLEMNRGPKRKVQRRNSIDAVRFSMRQNEVEVRGSRIQRNLEDTTCITSQVITALTQAINQNTRKTVANPLVWRQLRRMAMANLARNLCLRTDFRELWRAKEMLTLTGLGCEAFFEQVGDYWVARD